ncbi:MAG: PQQ-dependent sugar dehydrogenase, partial [Rhodothermales bacterium]|nr:PQQ-dependent sugar dehydrogenase [Rhodothermales bacterium]
MKQLLGLLIVLQFPFVDGVRAQAELVDAFPNLVFERPVAVRNDGVSRLLYVVEQFGKIHSVANSASATETKILLDINDRVVADPNRLEAGLLGLAFHPDYEGNGYLFVYYIADDPPRAVLSRFERSADDPDAADPNSEVVLLELSRQTYRHNGGDVVFGPDGYLYLPLGDGSSGEDQFNNAQDPSTLFGSIVRIDVDRSSGDLNYAIPPDNPFAGNTEGFREEIYAYGLRNPWRISFDRETGELWAGDVGERDWEEINIVSKGENYGWPLAGGLECRREGCEPAAYVLPVWSYPHTLTSEVSDKINRCVTGGYVYRGSEIPSLSGNYLYSDCASGILWAIEYDGVNPAVNRVVLDTGRFVPGF